MSDWWWADYVDKYLTDELAECAQWLKQSSERHFVVTRVVPMSDADGWWAAWLNFSPVEEAGGNQIKVLLDYASSSKFSQLVMRRAIVADWEPERTVVFAGDPAKAALRHKDGLSEWTQRSEIPFNPNRKAQPHDYTRPLASELCQRHNGSGLNEEPDGVMSFVVTV